MMDGSCYYRSDARVASSYKSTEVKRTVRHAFLSLGLGLDADAN